MLSLVYLSSATRLFSDAELDDILAVSRRNNARDGITGLLVYRDGDILQVLEGPEDAVRRTYARIAADPRHTRILVLDESRVDERAFADWAMGLRRVRGEARDGEVDFFGGGFEAIAARARGTDVYQYLQGFRAISA